MDSKVIILGLLGAIGIGFLLTRKVEAQTPTPIAPPGTPTIEIPEPVVREVKRTTQTVVYSNNIFSSIYITTLSTKATDWIIHLVVYSDGTEIDTTKRLTFTPQNAPLPGTPIEIYSDLRRPRVNVRDITLDIEGYGSPFILYLMTADDPYKLWEYKVSIAGQYAQAVFF